MPNNEQKFCSKIYKTIGGFAFHKTALAESAFVQIFLWTEQTLRIMDYQCLSGVHKTKAMKIEINTNI